MRQPCNLPSVGLFFNNRNFERTVYDLLFKVFNLCFYFFRDFILKAVIRSKIDYALCKTIHMLAAFEFPIDCLLNDIEENIAVAVLIRED